MAAARRAGMPLSRAGAQSFINRQSVAQIFAPARKSKGAIPARSLDALWQCDLLDMSSLPKEPNDDFQYILVCANVFDRMVGAEPLRTKKPAEVRKAMEEIMVNEDAWPEVVDTDDGEEFKGAFEELLQERDILHKIKDPQDRNALGVNDRSILELKVALCKEMADAGDS